MEGAGHIIGGPTGTRFWTSTFKTKTFLYKKKRTKQNKSQILVNRTVY